MNRFAALAALAAAPAALARPAGAQVSPGAQPLGLDTAALASGSYATMHTLLEKTIFHVDVLTLDIRFDEETARRLESLARDRRYSPALADSLADAAIHSQDAFARIEFKRNVSLGQFVDGIRENMRRARDAGILSRQDYETIARNLPRWFAFLEERPIRKGDQLLYRIRGDTLRTMFQAAGGEILLDQCDTGPERRLAVLGSYFAPKSDFREGLIKSLFAGGG